MDIGRQQRAVQVGRARDRHVKGSGTRAFDIVVTPPDSTPPATPIRLDRDSMNWPVTFRTMLVTVCPHDHDVIGGVRREPLTLPFTVVIIPCVSDATPGTVTGVDGFSPSPCPAPGR